MFDEGLSSLSTADLLESAADYGAAENRCAARRLEHAQIYADRFHPDNCPVYVVKPVIDLNDAVSVDAYEIPDRIRERVKLTHPVELFPYGNRETNRGIDLDHIQPYDPLGPPGQTSTSNLAPLGRFPHRLKTHAHGWNVRRLDHKTLEWTTPHGFTFHVGPTGTRRVPKPVPDG